MRNRVLVPLASLFICIAGVARAGDVMLHADLDGARPAEINTNAPIGGADFTLHDDMTVDYNVGYQSIQGRLTSIEVQTRSDAASSLFVRPIRGASEGSVTGTVGPITAAQAADLKAGKWQIKVQSSANAASLDAEISGQVVAVPEPGSLAIVAIGAGLLGRRRRVV